MKNNGNCEGNKVEYYLVPIDDSACKHVCVLRNKNLDPHICEQIDSISWYRFLSVMRYLDEHHDLSDVESNWQKIVDDLKKFRDSDGNMQTRHVGVCGYGSKKSKPRCANLDHLKIGTQKQNEEDKFFDFFYKNKDVNVVNDLKQLLNNKQHSGNAFVKLFIEHYSE